MAEKVYRVLGRSFEAHQNCIQSNNQRWREHWKAQVDGIVERCLPSGAGIDAGTSLDWERSKPDRIVLCTSYHHMSENGFYDGWTEHDIIITPSLSRGFDLRITGRNRNDIKGYLVEIFDCALGEPVS